MEVNSYDIEYNFYLISLNTQGQKKILEQFLKTPEPFE